MKPDLIVSRCSTISQLSLGISQYFQVKQSTYALSNFIISYLCSKDMFLSTNVSLGVISSPMFITSKGLANKKPYPNFSTSSKSSMASHISFIVDRYCYVRCCNYSTFVCAFIRKLHRRAELWKRLHRRGHKSILHDAKEVIACKILPR
jgi:hypothetical protein